MNNNKTLIIIFGVLLALFVTSKLFDRPQKLSFEKELITVDTANVSEIKIGPKAEGKPIYLRRNQGKWTVLSEEFEAPAAANVVQSILRELSSIETLRLVGRSEEKWAEFGVTETAGTHVEVLSGSKPSADFIIGRFNFNQETRQPISYIRKSDDNDTYAVEGFLGLSFDQSFDNFRDKTLVHIAPESIRGLTADMDGTQYRLSTDGTTWTANGIPVDSISMTDYLVGFRSVNGSTFYNASMKDEKALNTLVIESDQDYNIRIELFGNEDPAKPYVLHSSENPGAYFLSDSSGIYLTIFEKFKLLIGA